MSVSVRDPVSTFHRRLVSSRSVSLRSAIVLSTLLAFVGRRASFVRPAPRRGSGGLEMLCCRDCGRRTSVTAGTIFDRTRTPLPTWFAAAWFITSQKNGVSALGLQRVLGLKSYETAWAWMHKFRRAMVVPGRGVLSGTVEINQSYVGGISRGKAGRSSDKIGVMVAAEMVSARKLGRIRLEPAPNEPLARPHPIETLVISSDGAGRATVDP